MNALSQTGHETGLPTACIGGCLPTRHMYHVAIALLEDSGGVRYATKRRAGDTRPSLLAWYGMLGASAEDWRRASDDTASASSG